MTNFLKLQSCLMMFKASYQVNIVVDIFACVIPKSGTLLKQHIYTTMHHTLQLAKEQGLFSPSLPL